MGNPLSTNDTSTTPRVETNYGTVEGRVHRLDDGRALDIFLGIPFAKPPVGALRFKKPEPPEPWTGVLPAKDYKKRSIQRDFFWDAWDLGVGKSEDCLYLNVIAPTWNNDDCPKGFPVMVFIHGGGFVMDSAVKYYYTNCARTLARHGVIVVTVQYRLGFLGFFCTGDHASGGNFGVWDQLAAIRWLRENISHFNGDPERITLFGQSAGAVSIDLLCLSPLSRDLFQQAIIMGGNCETIWAVSKTEDIVKFCRDKAHDLGYRRKCKEEPWSEADNEEMMEFLRTLPAEKFELTLVGDQSIIDDLRIAIVPVIDGELLPKSINELRREAPPKAIMAGVCQHEGLLFLASCFRRADSKLLDYFENRSYEILQEVKEDSECTAEDEKLFRALYNITEQLHSDDKSVQETIVSMMSDFINNVALHNYCAKTVAQKSMVYRYVFEHYSPASMRAIQSLLPFIGATHGTELVYIFDVNMFFAPFIRSKSDRKVLELTTRLWTNFAKFGNPNGDPSAKTEKEFDFTWRPVTPTEPHNHLHIREEPVFDSTMDVSRLDKLAPLVDAFIHKRGDKTEKLLEWTEPLELMKNERNLYWIAKEYVFSFLRMAKDVMPFGYKWGATQRVHCSE